MTNHTITFPDDIERALFDDDPTAADDNAFALRSLLINPDDDLTDIYTPRAAAIERPRFLAMIDALTTDTRSLLMLALSLCPLHACDYAICFDDADPECESLRACFPSHDT